MCQNTGDLFYSIIQNVKFLGYHSFQFLQILSLITPETAKSDEGKSRQILFS